MNYGFKITTHGRALLAACMDLGAALDITRVAVGSGQVNENTDLADMHELVQYAAEGAVADRRREGDRLFLTVQYSNQDHPDIGTFQLAEFIVFAQHPDTGAETDLLYATLGDYPQSIPAYRPDFPPGVWNFPLTVVVSSDLEVSVSASPGLVTSEELVAALEVHNLELKQALATITHYGTCSTAAATAAKVVALAGFSLVTGARIAVKFTVTNTAANPTLNVNGTGAKAIYYRGAAITAGYLAANRTYEFVYNGTQYELVGDVDTNTTYTAASVAPLAAGTAAVGTSVKYAREDHVHPSQTSVTGNAGTATKLKTARKIGSASFDGSADITLADIGAAASGHTHTAADVGAVPTTRKVNGKALSADITLTAEDVGAAESGHTHPAQTSVSGNAGTATKLKTARDIALTGDITGSAQFDGSKDVSITAVRRGVSVTVEANGAVTKPWHKFASITLPKGDASASISFHVRKSFTDAGKQLGILTAFMQQSLSSNNITSASFHWESCGSDIDLSNFVLAHGKDADSKNVVELWCKCPSGWAGYNFDVIAEGSRRGIDTNRWTLYDAHPTTGLQEEITSGYTQVQSTLLTIKNPISGNAGTATKLATARKIGSASFDGSADITLADIGAAASGHTHTAADVGAVPTTRKVNGKALSADVTLAATDVGAVAAGGVAAIQVLTLAEYNALATKNATTLYLIKE